MLPALDGSQLHMPGMATAHSHAFQRALRGHAQRQSEVAGSFWSWRHQMYQLASALDPQSIYDISRLAYAELAMAGVTAVGEFHYVQHQPDGTPYEDRTELAQAVIEAARSVGIRISLLRVIYQRAGAGRDPEPGQRRFCDPSLDLVLGDVEDLSSRFVGDPLVQVGLAVHSVRAVPLPWILEASSYAKNKALPFHMHLSEQRKELEECIAEHGRSPVQLMADHDVLDENFVAVHATHLSGDEIAALGSARSFVCVCRTTERDLGDGLFPAREVLAAGARLCTGVDSHAISDPFEEARAIELDERSRLEGRTLVSNPDALFAAATTEGYAAIGMELDAELDRVALNADDIALVGLSPERLEDGIIYAAAPRCVESVQVAGTRIVSEGRHRALDEIIGAYRGSETLTTLGMA